MCRRKAILEYFQEEEEPVADDRCCDVCEANSTMEDCQDNIRTLLEATKEISVLGEKKVEYNSELCTSTLSVCLSLVFV